METGSGHDNGAGAFGRRPASVLAVSGLIGAIVAGISASVAGVGNWWGSWDFRTGFLILRWATYAGIGAGAVCLSGCVFSFFAGARRSLFMAAIGLVIAAILVGTVASWWVAARHVPMVHDISTDTENPPSFVAILPLRDSAPNSAKYGGPKIAALQHRFYPDIRPVVLPAPRVEAFTRALSAARAMGWLIVDADEEEGRIEATATTRWFRFRDDVIIRVTGRDGQSRVDVRSVSRVGRSDLGTNARRIRAYAALLKESG